MATMISRLTAANEQIVDAVMQGLAKGWPSDKKPQLDETA